MPHSRRKQKFSSSWAPSSVGIKSRDSQQPIILITLINLLIKLCNIISHIIYTINQSISKFESEYTLFVYWARFCLRESKSLKWGNRILDEPNAPDILHKKTLNCYITFYQTLSVWTILNIQLLKKWFSVLVWQTNRLGHKNKKALQSTQRSHSNLEQTLHSYTKATKFYNMVDVITQSDHNVASQQQNNQMQQ